MFSVSLKTRKAIDVVDLTQEIQRLVKNQGNKNGAVLIHCPHTTAGIALNEKYDPAVTSDVHAIFSRLIPKSRGYAHAEGNSDAHAKALLVGNSTLVPFENNRLLLGHWQGILFFEFDGPRNREVLVQLLD